MNYLKDNYYKADLNVRVNNLTVDGKLTSNGSLAEVVLPGMTVFAESFSLITEVLQVEAAKIGNLVILRIPSILIDAGDQNSAGGYIRFGTLPVAYRPKNRQEVSIITYDGTTGFQMTGSLDLATDGTIKMYMTPGVNFTKSSSRDSGKQYGETIVYLSS